MEQVIKGLPKNLNILLAAGGILAGLIFYMLPVIYAGAAAAGILYILLLFRKPVLGLYAAAIAIVAIESNMLLFLVVGLTVSVYAVKYILRQDFTFPPLSANIPLAAFLFFAFLAAVTSAVLIESLIQLAVLIVCTGLYLILAKELKTKESMNLFIMIMCIAALLASFHGIYQFVGGAHTDAAWVDNKLNPDLKTRVYSTFTNANVFAEYLAMILPLLAALFLSTRDYFKKLILACIGFPIFIALLLTYSRSSWMGLAFSVVIIIYYTKKPLLLLSIPLILAAPFILPPSVLQRLTTISLKDSSIAYRMVIYECTGIMISDYWATGVGLGYEAYRTVFANYWGTAGVIPYHSHNTYLQILAETGIGGFISFLWFSFRKMQSSIVTAFKNRDGYFNLIIISCAGAIAGLLLTGIGEYVFFKPKILYTFWILFGVLSAAVNNSRSGEAVKIQDIDR